LLKLGGHSSGKSRKSRILRALEYYGLWRNFTADNFLKFSVWKKCNFWSWKFKEILKVWKVREFHFGKRVATRKRKSSPTWLVETLEQPTSFGVVRNTRRIRNLRLASRIFAIFGPNPKVEIKYNLNRVEHSEITFMAFWVEVH